MQPQMKMLTKRQNGWKLTGIIALTLVLTTSCKVEFTPNSTTQVDCPAVYCLLDQDDDTTYIRIQRNYLGEGNLYDYAAFYDSINYPQGSLDVKIIKWRAWRGSDRQLHKNEDREPTVLQFDYMLLNSKDSGSFNAPRQPVYVRRTAGELDTNCIYELVILKNGDTLATSSTTLLSGNMQPIGVDKGYDFQFLGAGRICTLRWNSLWGARRYQYTVRFHYRDFIRTWNATLSKYDTTTIPHYVDIEGPIVRASTNSSEVKASFPQSVFLHTIADAVKDDPYQKNVMDSIDIFVSACNEDFSAYLYSNENNGTINQDRQIYTNIEGGVGIFASRRTNIHGTCKANISAQGAYMLALQELGVGFENR